MWGARGAAAAAVVADVVNLGFLLWAVRRELGHVWPVPGSYLGKVVGLLAISVAAGVLAPVPDFVQAVIGTGLFAIGALALRLVPSEVLDALPWRRP